MVQGKIRVLHVDDEKPLLDLTKIYLERTGDFTVETAQSAAEALKKLSASSYDAIVSDYQMPGMDGIAFLKAFRSSGNTIPFIIFTGRGREKVVIEAINNGADFYIQKGGEPKAQFAELAHKIRQAVQRQRAERSRIESEKRLADIINFLPDATFVIDKSGHVIAWNKAIEEMTGVPASGMLGKGNYEYAIPFYGVRRKLLIDLVFESDDVIAKYYSHVVHQDGVLIADTTLPRPRGRVVTLMGKASPLYNKKGEIVGAIESIRDITERKRAEDELRAAYEQLAATEEELRSQYEELAASQSEIQKQQEQLEEIAKVLPGVLVRFSAGPNGKKRVTYVSSRAPEVFGIASNAEDFFERFTEHVDARDRDAFLSVTGDAVRTGQPWHFEGRYARPSGGEIWFEGIFRPVRHGSELVYSGILSDITGRKRAEETLRASEEKFRAFVEASPDITWEIDPDGTILYCSPVVSDVLGFKPEEVVGKSVMAFAPEQFRPSVKEEMEKYVGSPLPSFTIEVPVRHRDGRDVILEIHSAPVFDGEGKMVALRGIARDITRFRRIEEALQVAIRKLTLLSSITRHDILNQLMVIKGYMGLLVEENLDPTISGNLRRIMTSADQIADIIQFTKDYECVGVKAPAWQDCRQLVDTAAREAPLGQVRVQNDLPEGLEIFADPLIGKVFYNLMENAVKHGGKTTTIRFLGKNTGSTYTIICEDDGVGIPVDEKEKIFEREYGKNTGLGLFLVREILGMTGITITETGEPGSGARFEIVVPKGAYRIQKKMNSP